MKKFLLLATSIALFSCTEKQKNNFDITSVRNHIEEANKTYGDRFFKNDSTIYANLYTKDAVIMPEYFKAVSGRAAIFNYYYNGGKNEPITIDIKTTNVYGNQDLVSEEGTYTIKDEKKQVLDQGKFIALWKQEDKKWKLYREIWNTDIMPK